VSHLFAYFETAERKPLRVMSLDGTKRTRPAGLLIGWTGSGWSMVKPTRLTQSGIAAEPFVS
jgi:hypothetical protein